jgi:hypothetical protein
MWTKALRLLAIVIVAMTVSSCGLFTSVINDLLGDDGDILAPVAPDLVQALDIPAKTGWTPYLEPISITSRGELDEFLDSLSIRYPGHPFISPLRSDATDFALYNIIIFPREETSGSNILTPHHPVWMNGEVTIKINRYVPGAGTDDMVCHMFAYRVKKSVGMIVFVIDGVKTNVINGSL